MMAAAPREDCRLAEEEPPEKRQRVAESGGHDSSNNNDDNNNNNNDNKGSNNNSNSSNNNNNSNRSAAARVERDHGSSKLASVVNVFDELAVRTATRHVQAIEELDGERSFLTWEALAHSSLELSLKLAAELPSEASEEAPIGICFPRGCLWLATTLAALRCHKPFVWFAPREGKDLPNSNKEGKRRSRNADAIRLSRPCLIVVLDSSVGEDLKSSWTESGGQLDDLPSLILYERLMQPAPLNTLSPTETRTSLLCYMFTGGSTGEPKCVLTTADMVMHEVRHYPSITPELGPKDRILQQSSVFWAASAWGQVDIALAFGSTLCVSHAGAPPARVLREAAITVVGAAPSTLAAWLPADVPSLRLAFTWGEETPAALSSRYVAHGVRLVELLISTEYWLSFYRSGSSPEPFLPIPKFDLEFGVLAKKTESGAEEGEVELLKHVGAEGELSLSGSFIMQGYSNLGQDAFIHFHGSRYYRTRDLVRLVRGDGGRVGVEFCGRNDSLIKVGAEFVNLMHLQQRVEEQLSLITPIRVCILPYQAPGHPIAAHAFLAPSRFDLDAAETAVLLGKARELLPHGAGLHMLRTLPYDDNTGKVQKQELLRRLRLSDRPSQPYDDQAQRSMLWTVFRQYPRWLTPVVTLCLMDFLAALLLQGPYPTASLAKLLLRGLARLATIPYSWYALLRSFDRGALNNVPFGRAGGVAGLLLISELVPHPLAALVWPTSVAYGAYLAWRHNRLMAWPIAFYVGIPHNLDSEIPWWVSADAWKWWVCEALPKLLKTCLWSLWGMLAKVLPSSFRSALATLAGTYTVGGPVLVWNDSKRTWATGVVTAANGSWLKVSHPADPGSSEIPENRKFVEGDFHVRSEWLMPAPFLQRLIALLCRKRSNQGSAPTDDEASGVGTRQEKDGECGIDAPLNNDESRNGDDEYNSHNDTSNNTNSNRNSSNNNSINNNISNSNGQTNPSVEDKMEVESEGGVAAMEVDESNEPQQPQQHQQEEHEQQEHEQQQQQQQTQYEHFHESSSSWSWNDNNNTSRSYENHKAEDCYTWNLASSADQNAGSGLYRGQELGTWHDWEKYWWDTCGYDVVDIDTAKLPTIVGETSLPGDSVTPAKSSTSKGYSAFESRVLKLLERHLQKASAGSLDMSVSLAGVDSLSFMALCRSLRVELKREFEPQEAMRCRDVGELVRRVEEAPVVEVASESATGPERGDNTFAIFFSPGMVSGGCSWLYESEATLDEETFEEAARTLVTRHEAMRYDLRDSLEELRFVQVPASLQISSGHYLATKLEALRNWKPPLGDLAVKTVRRAQSIVAFGLCGSWPRVQELPKRETVEGVVRVIYCEAWQELVSHVRAARSNPQMPFQIFLLQLREEGNDAGTRSFVFFVCTHAFSDGFSCFPIISDLAELYEYYDGVKKGLEGTLPPAAPSSFRALQQRLFDAISLKPITVAPDQSSIRGNDFFPAGPEHEPSTYNHLVQFDAGALLALRQCGRNFSIPLDVMLLGVVSVALLRAGVADENGVLSGLDTNRAAQLLSMTLYVPMRDGASNEAMVGLFSDWRDMTLSAEPDSGASVLGQVLDVAGLIRSRRWSKYDALQNGERLLVNILAMDEKPRGACAFRQTRHHEFQDEDLKQSRFRGCRKGAMRPMRLTFEQFNLQTWWLSMDLSDDRYPPWWCRRFVSALQASVSDLVLRPVSPLL